MLKKLFSIFASKKPELKDLSLDLSGKPLTEEMVLAAAILLIEVAEADEQLDPREVEMLCGLLNRHLQIPEDSLPELIDQAMVERQETGKIDPFVATINANWSVSQRTRFYALILKMVAADEKTASVERRLATQLMYRLQIGQAEVDAARRLAESKDF